MKQLSYAIMFMVAISMASCELNSSLDIATVPNPSVSTQDSPKLYPVSDAPFYSTYKDQINAMFPNPRSLRYDRSSNRIIFEGDMAYSEDHLAYYAKAENANASSSNGSRPNTSYEKHRVFSEFGRWQTVNRNNAPNITVQVPLPDAAFGLTNAQMIRIRDRVIDGVLAWNNSPNSHINITIGGPGSDCRLQLKSVPPFQPKSVPPKHACQI